MTKTKTLFATLAATAAVAAIAAPAAAQSYGGRYDHGRYDHGRYEQGRWDRDGNINARQAQIEASIVRGQRTGELTAKETANLRATARDISRLEARYRSNGLNPRERADLDRRLDRLALQVTHSTQDGDRQYGAGYGYRR